MNIDDVGAVRDRLMMASDALGKPLKQVLYEFMPDEYILRMLEPFMPDWADVPLHEFLKYIYGNLPEDAVYPDCENGEMQPFNIFSVLSELYR